MTIVLVDINLCVYGLYIVTNGSEGLTSPKKFRLSREEGFYSRRNAIFCY